MGKRKDKDKLDESSSKKKSKKHKKHKKKKSYNSISDQEEIDVVNDGNTPTSQDEGKSFKLKIKFGGRTLSTTEVVSDNTAIEDNENDIEEDLDVSYISNEDENEEEQRKMTAQNEEDAWLEALEKGELDDAGGLKKEKDTTLMTARQRALRGERKEQEDSLMQLPMYPERTEEENEEFERKRQVRAKKRKQQMQKQIEETKTQTIEKLLTKGQKVKREGSKTSQKDYSHVRYTNNKSGIILSYPEGMEYPLVSRKLLSERAAMVECSIEGCSNPKKYSCSKTNKPVCSLQCYKLIDRSQNVTILPPIQSVT